MRVVIKYKKVLIILFIVMINKSSFSQSLSVSELMMFINSQSHSETVSVLEKKGFSYYQKTANTFVLHHYYKLNGVNQEQFAFGKSSNLFTVAYIPNKSYYLTYKSKLLTSNYEYSGSSGNHKYYDDSKLMIRLGFDDSLGAISITRELK